LLKRILVVLICFLCLNSALSAQETHTVEASPWIALDQAGEPKLRLYFFWSPTCPHCTEARPVVEEMAERLPWLRLHSLSVADRENLRLYRHLAAMLDQETRSVPTFIFCNRMRTGFDDSTLPLLEDALTRCRDDWRTGKTVTPTVEMENRVAIPGIGVVNTQELSLPLLTVILAGLDSFNPCAFFVLLFLLSLLVHARSRRRMALVGGLFVLISGLVYFLFMAAWLNLFLWIGDAHWITFGAGAVAVVVAVLSIKEFFLFREGVSLSIPDSAKPGLFQRMRGLLNAKNLPAMLIGTLVLAVVANSYELLCTAGFPMVYTRALTLHQLPESSYYGYLAFYNLVYVIPLLLIVTLFVFTLGSRKLQEHEGRTLKLLSGSMMLCLGLLLLLAPGLLNNVLTAVALLLTAIFITIVGTRWKRRQER
jgi:thiol-disulfide isomerase/thioredoxin